MAFLQGYENADYRILPMPAHPSSCPHIGQKGKYRIAFELVGTVPAAMTAFLFYRKYVLVVALVLGINKAGDGVEQFLKAVGYENAERYPKRALIAGGCAIAKGVPQILLSELIRRLTEKEELSEFNALWTQDFTSLICILGTLALIKESVNKVLLPEHVLATPLTMLLGLVLIGAYTFVLSPEVTIPFLLMVAISGSFDCIGSLAPSRMCKERVSPEGSKLLESLVIWQRPRVRPPEQSLTP